MSAELKGLTAVVTGGTRGIGLAIAQSLIQNGARVIVTGTSDQHSLEGCKHEVVDFSLPNSLAAFLNVLKILSPDILINNAGINRVARVEDIIDPDLDILIDVNLRASIMCSRAVVPKMLEREWGRIVNISSIWGSVAKSGRAAYAATKLGLVGFTRVLAAETASKGIFANCVSPGYVNTDLVKRLLSEDESNRIIGNIPAGRMAEPEDIAELVLWLVSKNNRYLTGQNIVIDGGYSLV